MLTWAALAELADLGELTAFVKCHRVRRVDGEEKVAFSTALVEAVSSIMQASWVALCKETACGSTDTGLDRGRRRTEPGTVPLASSRGNETHPAST